MNVDIPVSLWLSITALGSVGVMLPVGLAAAAWLALGYRWKYTLEWLALLGAGSACVGLSKIAFIGWGIGVRTIDFTGISGHAYMATAVLPVAHFVALLPARGPLRAGGVGVGLLLGALIGGSRVVVNAHSVSEVVAGCALGGAVAIAFVSIAWKAEAGKLSPTPVVASLGAVVVALHGVPVPTQHWITEIALGLSGHERPYVRARWKAKIYRVPDRRADSHAPREPVAA
ncbi:phosphatase PAP2 family protein [Caballeronia sp. GAWG1-5s-s]|uniref:phosphatase PAP2 family protein n=1 Tax=Caballeronia sp. GAWG1-5s-s TaxID=2921743 RepID=UPI002029894B|nr:phosphatase PAP2 family protein [Caballeronia sp. GAWG1-5s-s]